MPHSLKVILVLAIFLVVVAIPSAIQPGRGSLEGVLTDEAGPVTGAIVEASHLTIGVMSHTTSDARGFYRFDGLPRGTYSLWITDPRHDAISIPRIFIEDGLTTRKDVRLVPRSSTESELSASSQGR